MDKIFLNNEFDKFWNKIKNGENFALLRYGDGERTIMCGRKLKAQEGLQAPDYISQLGKDIYSSLMLNEPNFYYAISCPCCDNEAYYWYSSRIKSKNITFANLWVNTSYSKFKKLFPALKRDAILIANYRAKGHKIGNLNILKHYEIDDDCITFWEQQASQMIQQIKDDFGNRNNLLYVVSAGPMSGPIIERLYKNNPNNCYIDFGSAIDIYYRENISRPYMIKNNVYAKRNCWMYDPNTTDFKVSVILNLYKRPNNLFMQLEALEKQSLKPNEILLYQDGIFDGISIPDELKNKFDLIEVNKENKGVWARFEFAQRAAKSKYVCVFDDDTIPGTRWLENCHTEMMKKRGLYGTIGIIMQNPEEYPFGGCFRVGWDGNLPTTTQVDFVGHSWFFEKEWLDDLLDAPKDVKLKYAGEDMAFSFQLQKKGISTFVPPHPKDNIEMFGSNPEMAIILGTSPDAISLSNEKLVIFSNCVKFLIKNNWKTLNKLKPNYVKKIFYELFPNAFKLPFIGITKTDKHRIFSFCGINISIKRKCYHL